MTRRAIPLVLLVTIAGGTASAQTMNQAVQEAKVLRCEFPLVAAGTWASDGNTQAQVAPGTLSIRFLELDVLDGTAMVEGLDEEINVRLAGEYLHFMYTLPSGFLHVTTVFNRVSRPGAFRAVHARHEYTDPSTALGAGGAGPEAQRPRQYYGVCSVG